MQLFMPSFSKKILANISRASLIDTMVRMVAPGPTEKVADRRSADLNHRGDAHLGESDSDPSAYEP